MVKYFLFIALFSFYASAFDHEYKKWNSLLAEYVISQNYGQITKVNYTQIKQKSRQLDDILSEFSQVSQKEFQNWTINQKLAFLINAYNAFTWKLIISHWPVQSIKDIGGWRGPWKEDFFVLLEDKRNLDWIEHDNLRKYFKESRIHFALNCASQSCPSLRAEAYIPERLSIQLDEQVKRYLSNSNQNTIDIERRKLSLSKIFDWFENDFVTAKGSIPKWLSGYILNLNPDRDWKIEYRNYDWSVNGY